MKKNLLLASIILLFVLNAGAQTDGLLISENFPYNSGNLTGQGSSGTWTSTGTGGDVTVTALTNNTGALIYPGYVSGTNYISTSNANTKDPYKAFLGSQTVAKGGASTFYISFVVNVSNSSNTSGTTTATPSVALRDAGGNALAAFYIADDGTLFGTQHLRFGISKTITGTGSGGGSYSNTNFSYNTTYLIIIRYDFVTGSNNDKMYMWINPSPFVEPSTAAATRSITSGTDPAAGNNVMALQLLEDNTNFFGIPINGTTAKLDGFKVAYARGYTGSPTNSVVAWNDLSPAGAPLPVKFGELTAAEQSNGIELSWSSYTEENTSHYEIERSSNGQSFSLIGSLAAAGNSSKKLDYEWLDGEPINGNNFYRVKSVDIDGHLTYSSIIKIDISTSAAKAVNIYPNPVTSSHITLQINGFEKGNYTVQFFNHMGQQVSQIQMSISEGNTTKTLQLPSSMKPGVYNFLITDSAIRLSKTFLVQ